MLSKQYRQNDIIKTIPSNKTQQQYWFQKALFTLHWSSEVKSSVFWKSFVLKISSKNCLPYYCQNQQPVRMEIIFYNLWQKIIGPQPIVGITDLNRFSPPPHPIIGPSLTSSQENLEPIIDSWTNFSPVEPKKTYFLYISYTRISFIKRLNAENFYVLKIRLNLFEISKSLL